MAEMWVSVTWWKVCTRSGSNHVGQLEAVFIFSGCRCGGFPSFPPTFMQMHDTLGGGLIPCNLPRGFLWVSVCCCSAISSHACFGIPLLPLHESGVMIPEVLVVRGINKQTRRTCLNYIFFHKLANYLKEK